MQSTILHIPHSSTHIPSMQGFVLDAVGPNLAMQTDWATDRIFDLDGLTRLVTPWSRLFCDVERLPDQVEPLYMDGRGFYYTLGYDRSPLRCEDPEHKAFVHRTYYRAHHDALECLVAEALDRTGSCHIIDCHSFGELPIGTQCTAPLSPDFCVGTDAYHTPEHIREHAVSFFHEHGYSVELDNPFAGCVIPLSYYRTNPSVTGMMIEVNKRLYMDGNAIINKEVEKLRGLMMEYVGRLAQI